MKRLWGIAKQLVKSIKKNTKDITTYNKKEATTFFSMYILG